MPQQPKPNPEAPLNPDIERSSKKKANHHAKRAAAKASERIVVAEGAERTPDEWSSLQPSDKKMGLVQFTLDKGV